MISKNALVWVLIIGVAILVSLSSKYIRTYGDLLPPIGQWTNCKNLPEVCDFPEWESQNLSDIVVYRFPNGSMIGHYIGSAPLER